MRIEDLMKIGCGPCEIVQYIFLKKDGKYVYLPTKDNQPDMYVSGIVIEKDRKLFTIISREDESLDIVKV